eukprot:CAMPEP_0198442176 /NCGR_PEP_ID=MMETSP1452-20131203/65726_1 /TAXON_ID=1181717 /ORGANISM="Synchroma pusillum, Strain CCMP3072" /LENGTH=135 /DNA_ID=CAMNT_0044162807 /DNA_START=20 /DNA_END=424 /DNA_ORIENTATION=+
MAREAMRSAYDVWQRAAQNSERIGEPLATLDDYVEPRVSVRPSWWSDVDEAEVAYEMRHVFGTAAEMYGGALCGGTWNNMAASDWDTLRLVLEYIRPARSVKRMLEGEARITLPLVLVVYGVVLDGWARISNKLE